MVLQAGIVYILRGLECELPKGRDVCPLSSLAVHCLVRDPFVFIFHDTATIVNGPSMVDESS